MSLAKLFCHYLVVGLLTALGEVGVVEGEVDDLVRGCLREGAITEGTYGAMDEDDSRIREVCFW